jgi:GTP-binding protein HflX
LIEKDYSLSTEAKACLVSMISPKLKEHSTEDETKISIDELRELMRTLHIEVGSEFVQNKKSVDPATMLGSGKLQEIAEEAKEEGANILVFDFELTASQIRNIKKITDLSVVDRCHVILEIFAKHAQTREAKIQIEIARLQYVLPRLSGFWTHLSRQKGGVGVRGGEGEQQIELDRRIIRERIEFYKRELKEVVKSQEQQKKRRQNQAITAALVGYTNAGKSSLMNRLCKVDVLEEDKLFATLDSTFRTLTPDTRPPMILIDTVGFLSNLPNTLIDGFRTTLESAMEAELLIIVCDISDPHYEKHLQVTFDVLNELKLEKKEKLIVFNKKDLLENDLKKKLAIRTNPDSFLVSTFDKEDMKRLREHIINYFLAKQAHYDLFVPYEAGSVHSSIEGKTNIISRNNLEKGIFYRVRVPEFIFQNLGIQKYILSPDDPLLKELQ